MTLFWSLITYQTYSASMCIPFLPFFKGSDAVMQLASSLVTRIDDGKDIELGKGHGDEFFQMIRKVSKGVIAALQYC